MLPEGNDNNNTSISTSTSNPVFIWGGVLSSNSVSIDSAKLDIISLPQSEMEISIMELNRVVLGMCTTQ